MLRQCSRQHIDQLSQHVETTLTGFHTFLLKLLVKSFHDDGDLQRARDINTQKERESVATASGGYCRKWNISGPIKGTLTPDGQNRNCSQQKRRMFQNKMIQYK